jgi:hypothetical protein
MPAWTAGGAEWPDCARLGSEAPLNARAFAELQAALEGAQTNHVIEWDGKPVNSLKKAIRSAATPSGAPCPTYSGTPSAC